MALSQLLYPEATKLSGFFISGVPGERWLLAGVERQVFACGVEVKATLNDSTKRLHVLWNRSSYTCPASFTLNQER